METKEYRTHDKSNWGEGQWQQEPDKTQWTDEETGLPCIITRHDLFGHLCGYVGVTEDHPLFGKQWDDDTVLLSAHGGVNFSSFCQEGPEDQSICHLPAPGESDRVWWFGFDCGHAHDFAPAAEAKLKLLGMPELHILMGRYQHYRDYAYVQRQVINLARQLKRRANIGGKHGTSNGESAA